MGAVCKGGTVLFAEMTPPDGGEDALNEWYDGHRVPGLVGGVPGFLSARRYRSPLGPHYLAVYELESPEALEHAAYRRPKDKPDRTIQALLDRASGVTRYVANEMSVQVRDGLDEDPVDAAVVIAALFMAPPERWGELVRWYETEHSPMLLENPDWLMVRHLEIYDYEPDPCSHLMLHYVRDASVLESPELARARETEWRNRLAAEDWFTPFMVVYQALGPRIVART